MSTATDEVETANTSAAEDRWRPLFVVTIVLLVCFGGLIVAMVVIAGSSSDVGWTRRSYIFASAEAIVFTSVGWLFGREVHRSEAKSAKEDADKSKQATERRARMRRRRPIRGSEVRRSLRGTGQGNGREGSRRQHDRRRRRWSRARRPTGWPRRPHRRDAIHGRRSSDWWTNLA